MRPMRLGVKLGQGFLLGQGFRLGRPDSVVTTT
jgi:hypothetical protein